MRVAVFDLPVEEFGAKLAFDGDHGFDFRLRELVDLLCFLIGKGVLRVQEPCLFEAFYIGHGITPNSKFSGQQEAVLLTRGHSTTVIREIP